MVNEKLLKTRLSSIEHYKNEIKKLGDALKVTKETCEENLQSLKEFLPFSAGDVLIQGNQIFLIKSISRVTDDFLINVTVNYADGYYGCFDKTERTKYLPICNPDYKIITNLFNKKKD